MNTIKLPKGTFCVWSDEKLRFLSSSNHWGDLFKAAVFNSKSEAARAASRKRDGKGRPVTQYEAVRLYFIERVKTDPLYKNLRPAAAFLHEESQDGRGNRIGNVITFFINDEDAAFFDDLKPGQIVKLEVNEESVTELSYVPEVRS